MMSEAKVGAIEAAKGSINPLRQDNFGALVASLASGKYREAVLRGNVYTANTAASGVAPGTAIGTTAAYSLYNPANSGVRLVLLWATLGYISGTLGAGTVHLIGHLSPSQTAHSGTAITPRNCIIGNNKTGAGLAYTTATVPSGGAILCSLWSLGARAAATALGEAQNAIDLDGAFVVDQGAGVSMQATAAAGTSPLVVLSLTWEEVPVLN